MINISVIICTHNPREDYLRRTLEALEKQSLPKDQWELLLVDNASAEPLVEKWDLSWHPHSRHVHEAQLGLTAARLRGISESRAELLVFVDDDNLLDADYLEKTIQIGFSWPQLGVWGGKITGIFEEPPSKEIKDLLWVLAVNEHELNGDKWSNAPYEKNHAIPYGAGMCLRRIVAKAYYKIAAIDQRRQMLDRQGSNLISSGDTDMALVAVDIGLGCGIFEQLTMKHLIPKKRIAPEYLQQLHLNIRSSMLALAVLRGQKLGSSCLSERIFRQYRLWRAKGPDKIKIQEQILIEKRTQEILSHACIHPIK